MGHMDLTVQGSARNDLWMVALPFGEGGSGHAHVHPQVGIANITHPQSHAGHGLALAHKGHGLAHHEARAVREHRSSRSAHAKWMAQKWIRFHRVSLTQAFQAFEAHRPLHLAARHM